MTAIELESFPWATNNVPNGWDFRDKTAADLEPLCFGVYVNTVDGRCKIIYGGERRAREALTQVEGLGLVCHIKPPSDSLIGNSEETVVIRGWCWSVHVEGVEGIDLR
jgi:hypothetical protein